MIFELAHHMALVPLLWLGLLAYYGQRRSPLWWALGFVFAVSWLADTWAHFIDPWLVSAIYPMLQAVIFGVVILPPKALGRFVASLGLIAGIAFGLRGIGRPEVFLHTVAWMGLCWLAWPIRELRFPVLLGFGVGWLGWIVYSIAPGWPSWGIYQGIRAIGMGGFCWASAPRLVRI